MTVPTLMPPTPCRPSLAALAAPLISTKSPVRIAQPTLCLRAVADVPGTGTGSSSTLLTTTAIGAGGQAAGGGSVSKVFDILTRGESGLAQQFKAVMKHEVRVGGRMRGTNLRALVPLARSSEVSTTETCLGLPSHSPAQSLRIPKSVASPALPAALAYRVCLSGCLKSLVPCAQVEAVEHIVEDAGQHNVALDRLGIALGPDLRAMYPLVMNFGVEGELEVSGPAHPDQVRAGTRCC